MRLGGGWQLSMLSNKRVGISGVESSGSVTREVFSYSTHSRRVV
jgi:hypothetical protein